MPEDISWVQVNRTNSDDDTKGFRQKITIRSIVCNKIVRGWILLTVFAATVPVLVYYFVIDKGTYETDDSYTCLVEKSFRITCGKVNITSNDCENVNCCFDKFDKVCYHYLPSKYSYDIDENEEYIPLQIKTPYNTSSLKKLHIGVKEIDENKVSLILSQEPIAGNQFNDTKKNYEVRIIAEKLMVEVSRSNGDLLLSTTKGPLIASQNYWEWSLYLTNHSLFGLNKTLINTPVNSTFKKVIYKNKVDHSTVPILWAYNNKQFHGVIINHDGPLEIDILPSNIVILRGLSDAPIEIELAVGPTPSDLHHQQTKSSALPPPWVLGTHMCRRGSSVNLTELLSDYNMDSKADSDCIHENLVMGIMNDNGENINKIKDIIKSIKDKGSRLLLSVPPHVLQNFNKVFNRSLELDLLLKYNNSIYTGRYMNEAVVYPDYKDENSQLYIEELMALLNEYVDKNDISGLVLYDNWPVNENYSMSNSEFPYLSKELQQAMSSTVPWNCTGKRSVLHMQEHNVYGANQMLSFEKHFENATNEILIMSASKTSGQVQPSIIQNVNTSWSDLQKQIDNVLFNSISGNHLVSIPVCGDTVHFRKSLQETLCLRWYLVAATMPLFRISAHKPWRDYANLNTQFAQEGALKAINYRKILLSYYYTLLRRNEPVVRPMFYSYYENETTFSMRHQYMIGDSILVAHPFSTGRNKLQIYLPSKVEIWYELWGGKLYNSTDNPWINFDIVETDFIGFVSQGSIIPLKDDDSLDLIIALNCSIESCSSMGSLLDSNSYINFVSNKTSLIISDIPNETCNITLRTIQLYYYENNNSSIKLLNKNENICNMSHTIILF
ncbi:hypothetical protein NQ315_013762 [Exocentrus adspersus]|uniref:P-type domain-containing protein n=1 Tax=Exocentrus adspersus TaxID=1586481 RepID=A0AAV8W4C4_9CUCU|nr:hypothetical protein NQ315_013762 [Exocentrus adspersus]